VPDARLFHSPFSLPEQAPTQFKVSGHGAVEPKTIKQLSKRETPGCFKQSTFGDEDAFPSRSDESVYHQMATPEQQAQIEGSLDPLMIHQQIQEDAMHAKKVKKGLVPKKRVEKTMSKQFGESPTV